MKILIIQQKMIGDVLTSSILFESLREKYPNAQLDYLINSHTYPVVENNPFIDNFIFFTKEIEQSKQELWKFIKSIRQKKYDVVIDVYGKLSSILIASLSKAKKKIAYSKTLTNLLYSHTFKRLKTPEHQVSLAIENRMKLLEFLNIPFKNIQPKIYLTSEEINQAKIFLESTKINLNKPLFMIGVLGSNPSKTYPKNYMAQVLDTIVNNTKNVQILFNYIPTQKQKAKEIFELCNTSTQQHIFFNVFGKSIREFLAITKYCNALIGNEGGAINMAKALDIPTFTIFNPALTKHNWFGDNETKKHIAVHINDYIDLDKQQAKKDPEQAYQLFRPNYFLNQLNKFVSNVLK